MKVAICVITVLAAHVIEGVRVLQVQSPNAWSKTKEDLAILHDALGKMLKESYEPRPPTYTIRRNMQQPNEIKFIGVGSNPFVSYRYPYQFNNNHQYYGYPEQKGKSGDLVIIRNSVGKLMDKSFKPHPLKFTFMFSIVQKPHHVKSMKGINPFESDGYPYQFNNHDQYREYPEQEGKTEHDLQVLSKYAWGKMLDETYKPRLQVRSVRGLNPFVFERHPYQFNGDHQYHGYSKQNGKPMDDLSLFPQYAGGGIMEGINTPHLSIFIINNRAKQPEKVKPEREGRNFIEYDGYPEKKGKTKKYFPMYPQFAPGETAEEIYEPHFYKFATTGRDGKKPKQVKTKREESDSNVFAGHAEGKVKTENDFPFSPQNEPGEIVGEIYEPRLPTFSTKSEAKELPKQVKAEREESNSNVFDLHIGQKGKTENDLPLFPQYAPGEIVKEIYEPLLRTF